MHVLSTVPVHLTNLPHAPATIVCVPILATMTADCLKAQIEKIIGLPKYDPEGQAIEYSYELSPRASQHVNLKCLERVTLRSNVPTNSWLSTSLSRPTSYVSTWFNHAAVDDPSLPLKKKISAPLPVAIDVIHASVSYAATQSSQKSLAMPRTYQSHPSNLEHFSEELFMAFLDDLQIPEQKRQSIIALPLEKRASLMHLDNLHGAQKTPKRGVLHSVTSTSAACAIAKPIGKSELELSGSSEDSLSAVIATGLGSWEQRNVQANCSSENTPGKARLALNLASSKTPVPRHRSRSPVRLDMSKCPPTLDWNRPKSPHKSQGTGSSWMTSWWSKADDTKDSDPLTFIHRLNTTAIPASEKIAELIRLRVQLGTARASWITLFMGDDGLATLIRLMSISVIESSDIFGTILVEVLKCFRALLNVQASYKAIVESREILQSISRSARYENSRVQPLAFDLLSGICASNSDAHKIVFTGLCILTEDVRGSRLTWLSEKAFGIFRTSASLLSEDLSSLPTDTLRAALSLVNTVCNAWISVEDRVALRNEFLLDFDLKHLTKVSRAFPQEVIIQLDLLRIANDEDHRLLRNSLVSSTCINATTDLTSFEPAGESHCLSFNRQQDAPVDVQETSCYHSGNTHASSSLLEKPSLAVNTSDFQVRHPGNDLSDLGHDTRKTDGSVATNSRLHSIQASQGKLAYHGQQDEYTSLPLLPHLQCPMQEPDLTHDELTSAADHDFGYSIDIALLPPCETSSKFIESEEYVEVLDAASLLSCTELQHKENKDVGSISEHHTLASSQYPDVRILQPRTPTDPTKFRIPVHKEDDSPVKISEVTEGEYIEDNKLPRGRGLHRQTFSRALSDVSEASSRAISDSVIDARHDSELNEHKFMGSQDHPVASGVRNSMVENDADQDFPITEIQSLSILKPVLNKTNEPLVRQKDILIDFALPPPPPPPPVPPPPPRSPVDSSVLSLKKTAMLPPVLYSSRCAPKSSKPLKPVFWDKLEPNKIASSVWLRVSQRLDNELHQELMLSDFERYFCKEISTASRPMLASQHKNHVMRKITLIEHRRAKNMEVMLARIKISHTEIRQALVSMDDSRLGTLDQLRIMQENCPSDEEIQLVAEFVGETAQLGDAELYIREVGQVPHLYERMQSMIFRRSFDLEVASLLPDLKTLHRACLEVLNCQDLQDFLALALTAGNILNAATFRGNAQGFRLEGLMKLADVRSVAVGKSGATLLHYLVAVAEKKHKKSLGLSEKLAHCASANRSKTPIQANF